MVYRRAIADTDDVPICIFILLFYYNPKIRREKVARDASSMHHLRSHLKRITVYTRKRVVAQPTPTRRSAAARPQCADGTDLDGHHPCLFLALCNVACALWAVAGARHGRAHKYTVYAAPRVGTLYPSCSSRVHAQTTLSSKQLHTDMTRQAFALITSLLTR